MHACVVCVCVCFFFVCVCVRKGTVVNTSVLVFLASVLMGFSKVCGSPEMVIVGRFITGIHSGRRTHTHTHTHTHAHTLLCTTIKTNY